MDDRFSRTRLLVGEEGVARLANAHVAVIGLGGVGGYALEALARAGIGRLFLADGDTVDPSNLNRQVLALDSTLGLPKVEAARERVRGINPGARVETIRDFLTPDNVAALIPLDLDYAIDAIDTVATKVHLIAAFCRRGVSVVSCMGAGGKLLPTGVQIADISRTKSCPLARAVRQQLRKLGIFEGVPCVYSEEPPRAPDEELTCQGKRIQGTIAHVPGIIGLTAAGWVIHQIVSADR